MNDCRKLVIAGLIILGLLISAAPVSAKTFCGDVYLGFSFRSIPGIPSDISLGQLGQEMMSQVNIPFRSKVYYQDGVIRLDAEFPAAALTGTSSDAEDFQVFSLLIGYETYDLILLVHGSRQAYRLALPPELYDLVQPQDPMAALTSKEFIEAFNQEEVKCLGTKRLKRRDFGGLNTNGIEMSFKVLIPKADLAEMRESGVEFDPKFTLRLYLEEDTNFPLLYEIDSSMFHVTFQLMNLQRDRLPDELFEIPAFYTVKEYTVHDLESLVNTLARDLGVSGEFTLPDEVIEELNLEDTAPVTVEPEVG
ncbi:hypothetical protein J7J84_01170 [bacterium]|nr:hypothetical protein [bacterium]